VLYDRALHEPLTETPWSEARVRDAIAQIVADADAAYSADDLWPAHEWDGYLAALPLKNLYVGAAGVAWALECLGRRGFDSSLDLPDVAARALERFRAEPDFMADDTLPAQKRSSLFHGETGVAFVAWCLAPDTRLDDELLDLVRANVGNEANELMWGVAGTLLVARAMHERTRSSGWADAVEASAAALRAEREADGLWTQQLWGQSFRALAPSHGLVGNVCALGEIGNAPVVLRDHATREDGYANWGSAGRLQWCVGAPGIAVAAASYLNEDLLVAAAELVWAAGPPSASEKGAGLCHGTAGNGYALLATFARTRDERWLDRARMFAVHALDQSARLPPRYSLFTGAVGAALFAADCLEGRPRFPVLDTLEPA
jgi:lanthionine synthetase-like protein